MSGEVGAECGGNGVSEGEWWDVVDNGACGALGSYKASKCGWGVACHDVFSGQVGVRGGDGVSVCSSHVASIARGVHDFVEVADCELCGVGFKGGETVS